MIPLKVGDRVEVISSDIGHREFIGKIGTVIKCKNGSGFDDLSAVEMDSGETIVMFTYRFKPIVTELKYDPSQQGDKDDDI